MEGRIFSSFNKIFKSLETIQLFIFYCIKFYPQKKPYENIYCPVLFVQDMDLKVIQPRTIANFYRLDKTIMLLL